MKLYIVELRGFAGKPEHINYVVANDPTEAESKVRADLDKRDYGFVKDRETLTIMPIAEDKEYTNMPSMLYL